MKAIRLPNGVKKEQAKQFAREAVWADVVGEYRRSDMAYDKLVALVGKGNTGYWMVSVQQECPFDQCGHKFKSHSKAGCREDDCYCLAPA